MTTTGSVDGRPALLVRDLYKTFGRGKRRVEALRGLNLHVEHGQVLGLLGPNGAGKTTAVRVLTTLLPPDRGQAQVEGLDVVRDAPRVRRLIGLAGQFAAVDETLTGRENVEMVGRLYHLSRGEARRRAIEVLDWLRLADAADRPVRTYSGGMRRRLDLGASLVGRPRVLLLDEPTTGLDPRSRMDLWELMRGLVREGTTVLLTTQYLEEADQLADEIAVIDAGRVIASGTSQELKDSIGGDVLALSVAPSSVPAALDALNAIRGLTASPHAEADTGEISLPAGRDGAALLGEVVRRLDSAEVVLNTVELRRPSLDDVFLSLTGHRATDTADAADNAGDGPASGGSSNAAGSSSPRTPEVTAS